MRLGQERRDGANAVAIQPDGQIVIARTAFNERTKDDFALAIRWVTEPDFTIGIDPEPVIVERGQKIKVRVSKG